MESLVELVCACGARQHVASDRVEAGSLPPCRSCGAPLRSDAPSPAEAPPAEASLPIHPPEPLAPAPGAGLSPAAGDGTSRCPACGGPAKTVFGGFDGRDRMLACGFCGTKVDLPEARGFTRERVTERPGERIVERETRWENMAPEDEAAGSGAARPEKGQSVGSVQLDRFEINGQRFDSREAFEEHLRDILPEDTAADILSQMSEGFGPAGWTTTKQVEKVVVLGGKRHGRPKARRPRGLLARIRKLFG